VTTTTHALAYLSDELLSQQVGPDGLRLVQVPFVPELRLLLAEDAVVWWARLEADAGTAMAAPFWATAWPGGQAVARYILDNPATVAGRRVLDLASGSGLVAIAAKIAGAATASANDIDPFALAAITLNARANDVTVAIQHGDLLDGNGGDADVVLVGDAFYEASLAARLWPFLQRAAARGIDVFIGDPGRTHLPEHQLTTVARYPTPAAERSTEPYISAIRVLRPQLSRLPRVESDVARRRAPATRH